MALDLSSLPAPALIEALDYETILARLVSDLVARDPSYSAILESDPAIKILEVAAARELILRGRINDSFKATLIAFSSGSDLDQLSAFYGVTRQASETDADLRERIVLRIQGSSTAGGASWYRYQGLSASARLKDVAVSSPSPGVVEMAVLSGERIKVESETGTDLDTSATYYGLTRTTGETDADLKTRILTAIANQGSDGTATTQLVNEVNTHIQGDAVRVLTDTVNTVSATITPADVTAVVYLYPDTPSSVFTGLEASLTAAFNAAVGLGWDLTTSWLISSLHPSGVQRVELSSPTSNIVVGPSAAVALNSVNITLGGYDR